MALTEERSVHLFDYFALLKRRRWWLIVPIVLGILAGGLLVLVLPREYQSSTTLAVTSPSMSSQLLKATEADQVERLRAISHELLSREVLERVARDEGLGEQGPVDVAISSIRSRSSVSLPKTLATGTRSGPDTFLVTYTGRTPDETQRVANRLATAFIEQHNKLRETRAEDTSAFLGSQLGQSKERLKAIEERLRQIKEAYMGRLPEQTQANLQMVAGLRQQQENTAMALRSEQDRLAMLERQLEAMRQGAAEAPLGRGSASSPQERLVTLRQQLDEATSAYTEKHPEVQRLRAEIAAAETVAKAESQRPAAERQPALNADPVYRQLLAERESTRLRIRDHERSTARAGSEIARYQGRVETAPMVEQQLSSITREYELEKQQYTSLSERHQAAVLAEDLERRRAGEQFAVLYPAFLPTAPSSPNVPRVLLLSVLGGIVAAGALAFGREYLDRSVYDAGALQAEFELPVLAEIPRIAVR
jgi:polysaccharide chain length determinant protein (PEP-CTERM system associated)